MAEFMVEVVLLERHASRNPECSASGFAENTLMKTLVAILVLLIAPWSARAADRPNILWLVCEDASVDWIGCYGNSEARTPNIDAFAKQGFRYTYAYANAPVCATQRCTWITGINSLSMGTHPMRSRYPIPHDLIKYYPDHLRAAGYYTANHDKTDSNIGGQASGNASPRTTGPQGRGSWSGRGDGQTRVGGTVVTPGAGISGGGNAVPRQFTPPPSQT